MQWILRSLALVAVLVGSVAPAAAGLCRADTVPAASLFVPWLEVDLERCGSPDRTRTVLTVTNTDSAVAVAHVSLWTDWGLPILDFDLLLTGFDQVDLELESLLCDGFVPPTGPGVSPVGSMSEPLPSLPLCEAVLPYNVPIPLHIVERIQRALTGRDLGTSAPGQCAGAPRGDLLARTSITVDLLEDCSLLLPDDFGYFDEDRRDNVLLGTVTIADGPSRRAAPVLHLEANPVVDRLERSFYRRLGAGDVGAREPLPTEIALTYQASDADPVLRLWREVSPGGRAVPCGTTPPGIPAALAELVFFDHEENPTLVALDPDLDPGIATGAELIEIELATLSGAPSEGWVFIEGRHEALVDVFDGSLVADDRVQIWATIDGGFAGGDRLTAAPVVLEALCPDLQVRRGAGVTR